MILYHVFRGDSYYPNGGWNDLWRSFFADSDLNGLKAVQQALDSDQGTWDWLHVVKTNKYGGEVIMTIEARVNPGEHWMKLVSPVQATREGTEG